MDSRAATDAVIAKAMAEANAMVANPNRPTHAMLKIGRNVIKTKIDWEAYDPKKPNRFTVWGFNKKYEVDRSRITFCKKLK